MVAGRSTESRTVASVVIPSAAVSNKALTANVATLTTSAGHGFITGQQVVVTGVDATFDGTYTIASVPTTTTFTYAKTAADVVSAAATGTALSTNVTALAASFNEEDAGRPITGTGIPAGATLATVTSDTAGRLSVAATTAGTITATLGGGAVDAGLLYGFLGWSPETDAESETYTVAAANAGTVTPDRVTSPISPKSAQRARG